MRPGSRLPHTALAVMTIVALLTVAAAATMTGCGRNFTPASKLTGTNNPATQQPAESSRPIVGQPVPEFSLEDLDGNLVSSASLQGKPVVLHFWATWCQYCRAEMKTISDLHDVYGDQVTFVGINNGEDAETVKAFLDDMGYTWTVLLDPDAELFSSYGFRGVPVTIFLGPDGTVLHVAYGMMPDGDLEGWITESLR